jgi:hypothetical protein
MMMQRHFLGIPWHPIFGRTSMVLGRRLKFLVPLHLTDTRGRAVISKDSIVAALMW